MGKTPPPPSFPPGGMLHNEGWREGHLHSCLDSVHRLGYQRRERATAYARCHKSGGRNEILQGLEVGQVLRCAGNNESGGSHENLAGLSNARIMSPKLQARHCICMLPRNWENKDFAGTEKCKDYVNRNGKRATAYASCHEPGGRNKILQGLKIAKTLSPNRERVTAYARCHKSRGRNKTMQGLKMQTH